MSPRAAGYPRWRYFPSNARPPSWTIEFVAAFRTHEREIDSRRVDGLSSDDVLRIISPELRAAGYTVEEGRRLAGRIERPSLFGEGGRPIENQNVDAVHDDLGIVVEIEAGRGFQGGAVYRDLVRASLIVEASFLALGVRIEYRFGAAQRSEDFERASNLLEAIYANQRLVLPFDGIILVGY